MDMVKPKFIVSATRCFSYDREAVYNSLREMLAPLGGITHFIQPGQSVLIKPNLLAPRPPETAVTTHPAVIEAVVRLIQEGRAIPFIGDSPGGFGSLEHINKLWEITGMTAVSERTGAKLIVFEKSILKEFSLEMAGKKINIPVVDTAAAGFDVIINVAKLKTHDLTCFTGAIKNMFGLVPGLTKVCMHKEAPTGERLARVLVGIFERCTPDLNILDGVIGMEGEGPGSSGTPRETGLMLASVNALALDMVVEYLMGFPEGKTPVVKAAIEAKLGPVSLSEVTVQGVTLAEIKPASFALPSTYIVNRLPNFLIPILTALAKRIKLTRPEVERNLCTRCLICVRSCPVGALKEEKGSISVSYRKCIECFCCIEMCPQKAMVIKKHLVLQLAGWWRQWARKKNSH